MSLICVSGPRLCLQAKAGCPGGCTGPGLNKDARAQGPPAAAPIEASASLGNPQGLAARPLCVPTLWLCSLSLLFHLPALPVAWLNSSQPPYCSTRTLSLLVPVHPSPVCPTTSRLHTLDPGWFFFFFLVFIHHLLFSSFPHIHIHPHSQPLSLSLFPLSYIFSSSLKSHFNDSTCEKPRSASSIKPLGL